VRLVSTLRVGKLCYAGGKPDYVRGVHSFGVGKNRHSGNVLSRILFFKNEILNQVQDDGLWGRTTG